MSDPLLSLEEAATLLGYSPSGLRKIVNRTRSGKPGPSIRFFQAGRGPIKFRPEWVDDFVVANTTAPKSVERSPARKPAAPASPVILKPQFGFDPSLLRKLG